MTMSPDSEHALPWSQELVVLMRNISLLLDKLAALDFFPILLLGKTCRGSLVADAILGGDYLEVHFQREKAATGAPETSGLELPRDSWVADRQS
ncbi:hypothetical protein SRHO_G00259890 [Serrasalmus rhombeus]